MFRLIKKKSNLRYVSRLIKSDNLKEKENVRSRLLYISMQQREEEIIRCWFNAIGEEQLTYQ